MECPLLGQFFGSGGDASTAFVRQEFSEKKLSRKDDRRIDIVVDELRRLRIEVAGLQETLWFGRDIFSVADSMVLTSGKKLPGPDEEFRRGGGVAIVLRGRALSAWRSGGSQWRPISSRLAVAQLQTEHKCVGLPSTASASVSSMPPSSSSVVAASASVLSSSSSLSAIAAQLSPVHGLDCCSCHCPQCQRCFKSAAGFRRHNCRRGLGTADRDTYQNVCGACGRRFRFLRDLKRHRCVA